MRPGFVAPTLAAKMSNTLDQLTQGRVLINVVTGGFPAELAADGDFTDHDERYARTQEFMQVVRKAWTERKRWDHEGKYYRVEGGNVHPRPFQQPCPPFYFGGASEPAQVVGAEEADVYLLWGETLEMVRERIAGMRDRAATAGRKLRFGMRIHVVVRETEDEAWEAADALIADIPEEFEAALSKIQSRTDSAGEQRQQQMRQAAAQNGGNELVVAPNLWTGIGKARVGVGAALVGSGENVAARLQEYVDEGIDTFILSGYPHLEEAQRFGKYVMPHFAGRTVAAGMAVG
jgi:alkanesulfonate monooxygenase